LAQGYAANDDVEFVAGCGQQHNEAAWSVRLPEVLDYLLPAREDPPALAQRDYPPRLSLTSVNTGNGVAGLSYTSLFGFTYTLEHSVNLADWMMTTTTTAETLPWSNHTISDSLASPARSFWRLQANPSP
jgi:hypothetical protein